MRIEDAPKDTIRTNSGLYINIFDPKPEMICIEDIAHGLSYQSRFAGHLDKHYSVAQHSILCCERALPENKLVCLLHDASEAYMLDIPTPIKARMPEYKELEHNLMCVIAEKFGFKYPYNHPEIKEIDNYMVHLEWDVFFEKKKIPFKLMTAIQAKKEFLRLYAELTCKKDSPSTT